MFHINNNCSLRVICAINMFLVARDRWREIIAVRCLTTRWLEGLPKTSRCLTTKQRKRDYCMNGVV